MPQIVNVHEAKTHLSHLLDQAHAGEEIILAKVGNAYARLVPLAQPTGKRTPGRFKGMTIGRGFFEPLPEDELRAWEGQ